MYYLPPPTKEHTEVSFFLAHLLLLSSFFLGNVSFRALINSRLEEYSEATSKLEKSSIVTSVLSEVRNKSPSGGFIKMDKASGRWHEVSDLLVV